jgi:hypothetical protein
MDADKRCAPSKKYENNSCFSLDSLKIIANEYNKTNQDKINISNNKKELVNQLKDKFSSSCSTQTCWLRTNIVKNIENDEIHKNTFRPEGPKSKYGWLSTTNINEVIDQYHKLHDEFLFLGTVPYDFQEIPELGLNNYNFEKIYNSGKTKLGLVINLDESHQRGSHWVSLYTDLKKNKIYFFDSVGKPPRRKIKKFINKITNFLYKKKYNSQINVGNVVSDINKLGDKQLKQKYLNKFSKKLEDFDIRFNNIQHQFKNSECGVYSINFILRLVKDESFDEIINNVTKDDKMNECRQTYFNNT